MDGENKRKLRELIAQSRAAPASEAKVDYQAVGRRRTTARRMCFRAASRAAKGGSKRAAGNKIRLRRCCRRPSTVELGPDLG